MNDRMQSIVQMRQSGASYAMIKSEFGISDSTIVYSLKKAGLSRKRKAITDDIKKQIFKLRDEGLPFWQIAEQTGVSATGAYKVYIKCIEPEAAKLRRQGKSYTEIGQIFGVNSATARRMCLRAGSLGPEESAEAKAIEKPSVRIDIRIGSPVRIYSADRVGNGEWREGVVRDLYDCFFIVDYGKTRECFLYSDLTCPDTSWRFRDNATERRTE